MIWIRQRKEENYLSKGLSSSFISSIHAFLWLTHVHVPKLTRKFITTILQNSAKGNRDGFDLRIKIKKYITSNTCGLQSKFRFSQYNQVWIARHQDLLWVLWMNIKIHILNQKTSSHEIFLHSNPNYFEVQFISILHNKQQKPK